MQVKIEKYNPAELALLYGISRPTFLKWINSHRKQIGVMVGRFYNPKQVRKIFDLFGNPTGKKFHKEYFLKLFKIRIETFNRWLLPFRQKIGKVIGYVFTPKQKDIILQCLC